MTKFFLHTSTGGKLPVTVPNKREANKLARQTERLVGLKIVSVTKA